MDFGSSSLKQKINLIEIEIYVIICSVITKMHLNLFININKKKIYIKILSFDFI